MTILQVLKKARKLVQQGWAQGSYAYAKDGSTVRATHRHAAKFCVMGACFRAAGSTTDTISKAAIQHLANVARPNIGYLDEWNDKPYRRKADAVALFDKTIARLEKE